MCGHDRHTRAVGPRAFHPRLGHASAVQSLTSPDAPGASPFRRDMDTLTISTTPPQIPQGEGLSLIGRLPRQQDGHPGSTWW